MAFSPLNSLAAAAITIGLAVTPAASQDIVAESLSERVLFVTSGGYWEETPDPDVAAEMADTAGEAKGSGEDQNGDAARQDGSNAPSDETAAKDAASPVRGYYRLIAIRGEDNQSQLELQQIALTSEGPQLAMSIGIEEINILGAYITDIRPENSTGRSTGPGFAAFIYLKSSPEVIEPDTWTLIVDEFGEIIVEQSSN